MSKRIVWAEPFDRERVEPLVYSLPPVPPLVPRPACCEYAQPLPTSSEIEGCPEVIVRRCAHCAADLWWNAARWRTLPPTVWGMEVVVDDTMPPGTFKVGYPKPDTP